MNISTCTILTRCQDNSWLCLKKKNKTRQNMIFCQLGSLQPMHGSRRGTPSRRSLLEGAACHSHHASLLPPPSSQDRLVSLDSAEDFVRLAKEKYPKKVGWATETEKKCIIVNNFMPFIKHTYFNSNGNFKCYFFSNVLLIEAGLYFTAPWHVAHLVNKVIVFLI